MTSIQLTRFDSWDAFAELFHDGVHPVLEWKRTDRSALGPTGDFAVLSVLHHGVDDGRTPFLVELPWSQRVVEYIHTNQVDIAKLP